MVVLYWKPHYSEALYIEVELYRAKDDGQRTENSYYRFLWGEKSADFRKKSWFMILL